MRKNVIMNNLTVQFNSKRENIVELNQLPLSLSTVYYICIIPWYHFFPHFITGVACSERMIGFSVVYQQLAMYDRGVVYSTGDDFD